MQVYGRNVFNELKNNLSSIRNVYISDNFKDQEILSFLKSNNIKYSSVSLKKLNELEGGNHQGIVVIVDDYKYCDIEDFLEEDFIVMLDHLEDPHNLGAIIRTCEALGVKNIVIPKDRSVSVNGTVMKTSGGTLNYVKIARVSNLLNTINKLKENNFFVYASAMDGENFQTVDYALKKVLVIGNEGKGVSRLIKDNSDEIIAIPMNGSVNSLNASVAAAILIHGIKG